MWIDTGWAQRGSHTLGWSESLTRALQGFKKTLTVLVLCFRKIRKSDVEEEKLGMEKRLLH